MQNLKSSILNIKRVPIFQFFDKFYISDTDSFLFQVQTPDFYEDLAKVKDAYYDTSNFPRNKAIPDETAGYPIKSFFGLRSKAGLGNY